MINVLYKQSFHVITQYTSFFPFPWVAALCFRTFTSDLCVNVVLSVRIRRLAPTYLMICGVGAVLLRFETDGV